MNSPRVTRVVGTSIAGWLPTTLLTLAATANKPQPAIDTSIARLLRRHMTLHFRPGLEAGGHDRFHIVGGAKRDRSSAPIRRQHRKTIVLRDDGIPRHDDDLFLALELDIHCGREVRQELGMTPLDTHNRDKVPH